MPRGKRIRRITEAPHFRGFTPTGLSESGQPVLFDYEEYEAIRLCDFDGYNHFEASRIMNVSRPTFARIYENARRKVAYAFVQGLPIVFEGGKVYYDSEWYLCGSCGCRFNQVSRNDQVGFCALCGSEKVGKLAEEPEQPAEGHICICPVCGIERTVQFGTPCSQMVCTGCNIRMRRKGHHGHGNRFRFI